MTTPAPPTSPASRVRIALIGSGRIGQVHAMGIHRSEGAVLQVVADPFVAGAHNLVARLGGRATTDALEAIAAVDVDAVVVASPTSTHVDLIAACLDAGKPVLCEKPIDLDITRVDGLRARAAAATAAGLPVALGFNRRFDPHFAELHRRVASGEVGPLEQLTIISRDPAPAPDDYLKVSGGIFRDMTIHDFDTARWFVPDVVAVTAVGLRQFSESIAGFDDYDGAVVTLVGAGGQSVTITNSRHCAAGYDQRLEATGPLGTLSVGNVTDTLVRSSNGTSGDAGAAYQTFFLERYSQAYAAELEAFLAAVRGEAMTSPGFEDGRAALLLADAAGVSAREGRTVAVDLSA